MNTCHVRFVILRLNGHSAMIPIGGDESVPSQSSSVCEAYAIAMAPRPSTSAVPVRPRITPLTIAQSPRRRPVRRPAMGADQEIQVGRRCRGCVGANSSLLRLVPADRQSIRRSHPRERALLVRALVAFSCAAWRRIAAQNQQCAEARGESRS